MIHPYSLFRSTEGTVRLPFPFGTSQRVRPSHTIKRAIAKEQILRAVRVLFPTLVALTLTSAAWSRFVSHSAR